MNPPWEDKWHKLPRSAHNPKSITPANTIAQYDVEPFVVSRGKLFCQACREEVTLKRVSLITI